MTDTQRRPPRYPPHSRPVPADPAIDAMVAALREKAEGARGPFL